MDNDPTTTIEEINGLLANGSKAKRILATTALKVVGGFLMGLPNPASVGLGSALVALSKFYGATGKKGGKK